ncbi:helix-turn-helix domain-containing protein [Streptomyces sp. NPDC018026]|uniref:helix-turn-helix domain-containing protein n=1 Tax=Streptomyces sp. NPDC018026 TaxID=3365031 RepID=UPI0037BC0D40
MIAAPVGSTTGTNAPPASAWSAGRAPHRPAAATVRALGLHRNTVAARLRQVRGRLGVPLDDPSNRLALQMACRAMTSP